MTYEELLAYAPFGVPQEEKERVSWRRRCWD